MNRYALAGTIVVAVLVGLAIVGATLLHLFRPDASAVFIQQTTNLIGLVTIAAGVFYGFSRQAQAAKEQAEAVKEQGAKIETIEVNTNGRLHAKDAEIARLQGVALEHGAAPDVVTGTTPTTSG